MAELHVGSGSLPRCRYIVAAFSLGRNASRPCPFLDFSNGDAGLIFSLAFLEAQTVNRPSPGSVIFSLISNQERQGVTITRHMDRGLLWTAGIGIEYP
jgi:hypothetical protein